MSSSSVRVTLHFVVIDFVPFYSAQSVDSAIIFLNANSNGIVRDDIPRDAFGVCWGFIREKDSNRCEQLRGRSCGDRSYSVGV